MANSICRWQCPEDWSEWSQWLAAGLHARNRWRLPVLLVGILFAHGRRTVTTRLRAAGVSEDYQNYFYFLAALGRKTKTVAARLLALLLRTLPLPDRLRRGDDHRTAAQRRGVARLAAKVAARPATPSWPSGEIWQEQDQLGQARRPSRGLADGQMHCLRQNGHEALQDLPGDVPSDWRADSRGDRPGGSRLVSLLLDRSEYHGRGDHRSVRRPGDDRTGLPRCEGGLGAGQQQVRNIWAQFGRVPFESLDSYAGGTLVLEPSPRRALRSQPVAVGRRASASVPCRSSQRLAATDHGTRIIDACRRGAAAAKTPPFDSTHHGISHLT